MRVRSTRGLSLVEFLVAGVVGAVLMGGIAFILMHTCRNVWVRTESQFANSGEAQRSLDRMARELRQASQAGVLNCSPNSLDFLPIRRADGSQPPRVTYQRDGANRLVRTVSGASAVVASGVTAFLPTCGTNGLVDLRVTTNVTTTGLLQVSSPRTLNLRVWVQNP